MRRATWLTLVTVGALGWSIAALFAWALVARFGWGGIFLVGVATLVIALRVEIDADYPAASPFLMRRQYEQQFEGSAESRLARFAERAAQHRALYLVRTVGIALVLLGLNMFVLHQL
jgi:MFS family permease